MMREFKVLNFIWIILFIVSFGALIISSFHLNNSLYYLADVCNVVLFLYTLKKIKICKKIKELRGITYVVPLFLIVAIIGILINDVSPILALWGARNYFRYILFFFSCVVMLRKEHIEWFFEKLPKIYLFNFVLSLFQYFVQHLGNDYIGGIFGTYQGCNGSTTIFLNIAIAYFVSEYINKKSSIYKC